MKRFLFLLFFPLSLFGQPTVWIIGDSTVRNTTAGQQGWGDPLANEFDPAKVKVVNRAIGGRSSRTFLTEGRWDAVLENLKEGDFVLMQFGHNDGGEMFAGNRPRASIKGTGNESETGIVEASGKEETVHSFGWYLRKYCQDTLAKGATPVVISLIPRNIRNDDGLIEPDTKTYAKWAKESAEATGAFFIPFNRLLAERFNELGEEETDAIFCQTDHTHTSPKGASFNAQVLAEALRELPKNPFQKLLLSQLWLPHVFSDHMVLQRDEAVPIWGRSQANETITVSLGEQEVSTQADANGDWSLTLSALPAGGPHTLKVSASESREFQDVLIGEVWLCSGQSNMDFTVAPTKKRYFAGTANWKDELQEAEQPRIRMFTAEWTLADQPLRDIEGEWKVANPESVRNFSAVAWFFARELQDELDVPIGLITSAYGASTVEAWTSKEKLKQIPEASDLLKSFQYKKRAYRDDPQVLEKYGESLTRWQEAGEKGRAPIHPDPIQDQHNPAVLYNGMIAPLIPYAIRGAIWYQGESNVGTRNLYPALQKGLVEDWRQRWDRVDFPFYFVQLAGYKAPNPEPGDSSWASMREAQSQALELPNTGMAVTHDIGEQEDIHPRNKQDVGDRLARLALAKTYNQDLVATGPVYESATVENAQIRVTFANAADGLVAQEGNLEGFAIAGEDKNFRWAETRIDGESVLLSHPEIPEPKFVRYAWADFPVKANLFNTERLPAAPFRTDP
jgi:sialate O-acetylesterase